MRYDDDGIDYDYYAHLCLSFEKWLWENSLTDNDNIFSAFFARKKIPKT